MDENKASHLNVFFFVTGLDSGGIENYLLRFLKYSENKFTPFVICKSGRTGELLSKFEQLRNARVIPLHVGYYNILSFIKVFKLLRRHKPNTVCDFTGNFAGIILLIARLAGVKTRLVFYRGAGIRFQKDRLKLLYNMLVNKLVLKCATRILSNSKAALEIFFPEGNRDNRKFKVIYNGVDAKAFTREYCKVQSRKKLGLPEKGYIIGHVGRFDQSKNLTTIGNVASKICSKFANVYFVLCGKGTDIFVDELVNRVSLLENRVFSLGYQSDVPEVLSTYDLFLFPSIIEGQPNALIEAMISGLPIVASDIKPIKETTPQAMHETLTDPMNVDRFVKLVQACYLDSSFSNSLTNEEWARKQFNPNILFNEFLIELEIA